MNQLYPSFKSFIQHHRLLVGIETVIIAFSGGKDSVTLLLLLKELRRDIPFYLTAAYFNHRLRPDAEAEEHWVNDFCRRQRVELTTGGADVARYRKDRKLNLEHAASLLRYRFLEETAHTYPRPCIATAHTASDITETFFIKLLRGSGNRGLSAIYSKKEPRLIRPLLEFGQEEILSFLERNAIGYYQDSTNLENHFLRNKIRNVILPQLRDIEPRIDQNIYRSSLIFQQEYDYFKTLAEDFLANHLILQRVLPMAPLMARHRAVQRHILREYVRRLKGDLLEIGFHHIEGILDRPDHPEATSLPGLDLVFRKGYLMPREFSLPAYNYQILGPGEIDIIEVGLRLRVDVIDRFRKPADNFSAILPFRLLQFPLEARNPQKGDRYARINTDFSQPVFEMIRSTGLPPELRNLRPVIAVAAGELIWAVGSPPADRFKVTDPDAGPFIRLSAEW